MFAKQCRIVLQ